MRRWNPLGFKVVELDLGARGPAPAAATRDRVSRGGRAPSRRRYLRARRAWCLALLVTLCVPSCASRAPCPSRAQADSRIRLAALCGGRGLSAARLRRLSDRSGVRGRRELRRPRRRRHREPRFRGAGESPVPEAAGRRRRAPISRCSPAAAPTTSTTPRASAGPDADAGRRDLRAAIHVPARRRRQGSAAALERAARRGARRVPQPRLLVLRQSGSSSRSPPRMTACRRVCGSARSRSCRRSSFATTTAASRSSNFSVEAGDVVVHRVAPQLHRAPRRADRLHRERAFDARLVDDCIRDRRAGRRARHHGARIRDGPRREPRGAAQATGEARARRARHGDRRRSAQSRSRGSAACSPRHS